MYILFKIKDGSLHCLLAPGSLAHEILNPNPNVPAVLQLKFSSPSPSEKKIYTLQDSQHRNIVELHGLTHRLLTRINIDSKLH